MTELPQAAYTNNPLLMSFIRAKRVLIEMREMGFRDRSNSEIRSTSFYISGPEEAFQCHCVLTVNNGEWAIKVHAMKTDYKFECMEQSSIDESRLRELLDFAAKEMQGKYSRL